MHCTAFHGIADGIHEDGGRHGTFDHVLLHTLLHERPDRFRRLLCRQDDDGHFQCQQRPSQIQAVHVGQHEVQEHTVGRPRAGVLQSVVAARDGMQL